MIQPSTNQRYKYGVRQAKSLARNIEANISANHPHRRDCHATINHCWQPAGSLKAGEQNIANLLNILEV
jgi:hypothetical protein